MSPLPVNNTRNLPARSVNGCWTCRLRKKKCDETRPSCTACNILGITCHGYGRRPVWMDKGCSERAELERIKSAISNRSPKKRHSRQQRSLDRPVRRYRTPSNSQQSKLVSDEGLVSHDTPCHGLVTPELTSHEHSHVFGTDNMFSFENETVDETDTRLSLLTGDTASTMNVEILGLQSPAFDGIYPQLEDSSLFNFEDGSLSSSSISGASEGILAPADMAQDQALTPTPMVTVAAPSGTTSVSHGLQDVGSTSMFSLADPTCRKEDPLDEAFLIAYYTDNLYEIQFPFVIENEVQRDRLVAGWLLYLLFRSRAARKSTMILAEAHKSIKEGNGSAEKCSQFLMLAKRLVTKLSSLSMVTIQLQPFQKPFEIIEICFSHVQIMILQSICGKYMDWASSLRLAAQPLGYLIQIIRSDASLGHNTKMLNHIHTRAASMILAYHLWFDLMAASLFRQGSFLDVEKIGTHLHICTDELETITGCEFWVIQALGDILHLDVWRRRLEAQKRLSIIELARRGLEIHQRLKHGLDGLQKADHSLRGRNNTITSIYAHTAATYLNVVFSGPNPALMEIRTGVSRVLKEFYGLAHTNNASMSSVLAWPLCLVGCFLGREGRNELWNTMTDFWGCQGVPQSLDQVSRIIEECWRIRTEKGQDCDWSGAISSLQAC